MLDFLNHHKQLENERVLLTPFSAEHAASLRDIIFDEEVWKYMGMYVRNETDFRQYIEDTMKHHSKIAFAFLIFDKKTNRMAGSTRFGNINTASEKLEIGWTWYGREFHGTGLNKACKYELLKYGFEEIGLRRIQLSADLENIRSQKAIEKLGATKEGIFRNNYIDSTGKSKDDVYYSIIREEWPTLKNSVFFEFSNISNGLRA